MDASKILESVVNEYSRTVAELGGRLANYAIQVAQLQAEIEQLKAGAPKPDA